MKTAIVTGATSGIGKSIATHFAKNNWRLILLARREEILKTMETELPSTVHGIPCDLREAESIQSALEAIAKLQIPVNALINNAGIFRPGTFPEGTDALWEEHFQTNLMGPVRLTRGLWPLFLQQKWASIVNVSSTLAVRPIAHTGAYSALKAALSNWTQTLAIEGAPFGIRANAVSPGLVDTPIHPFHGSKTPAHKAAYEASQSIQPLQRIGQPQDIAPLVYHLASEESSWTTGVEIPVDGGILLNS